MFWIVLIIAALFFSWRNYKKNKPLIAARIAEEKEKESPERPASRYPTAAMGAGAS